MQQDRVLHSVEVRVSALGHGRTSSIRPSFIGKRHGRYFTSRPLSNFMRLTQLTGTSLLSQTTRPDQPLPPQLQWPSQPVVPPILCCPDRQRRNPLLPLLQRPQQLQSLTFSRTIPLLLSLLPRRLFQAQQLLSHPPPQLPLPLPALPPPRRTTTSSISTFGHHLQ